MLTGRSQLEKTRHIIGFHLQDSLEKAKGQYQKEDPFAVWFPGFQGWGTGCKVPRGNFLE